MPTLKLCWIVGSCNSNRTQRQQLFPFLFALLLHSIHRERIYFYRVKSKSLPPSSVLCQLHQILGLFTQVYIIGCAIFTIFFYSLWSESKRKWILFASYLHASVYSQTPFIRIIRFIFVQTRIHIFNLMQKNTRRSEYSLQSEYSFDIFILANIRFKIFELKQKFPKLKANFTCKWIFAIKNSITRDISLQIFTY